MFWVDKKFLKNSTSYVQTFYELNFCMKDKYKVASYITCLGQQVCHEYYMLEDTFITSQILY